MSTALPLHSSIAFTLLIGQIMGLMPLRGIFHRDESHLKITWKSWQFLNATAVLIGSIIYVQFIIVWIITAGVSLNGLISFVIYIGCLLNVILFFKIGLKWQKLLKLWRCVDLFDSTTVFNKNTSNFLKRKMNIIATVIIGISVGKINLF